MNLSSRQASDQDVEIVATILIDEFDAHGCGELPRLSKLQAKFMAERIIKALLMRDPDVEIDEEEVDEEKTGEAGYCHACQRWVDKVRGSPWHGPYRICQECFCEWYEPCGDVDPTSALSIGNATRRKLGLPLLTKSR